MYSKKIGKGPCHKIGWSNEVSLPLEFTLFKGIGNITIDQISEMIVKGLKIKDGFIHFDKISFSYEKRGVKKEINNFRDL